MIYANLIVPRESGTGGKLCRDRAASRSTRLDVWSVVRVPARADGQKLPLQYATWRHKGAHGIVYIRTSIQSSYIARHPRVKLRQLLVQSEC